MRKLEHLLKDGKNQREINATLCFVLSVLEKVHIIEKKREVIPLTHKANESILSKINRNMDGNYCFSDAEATVKAVSFKKHNTVEMNNFYSALETNQI